MSTALEPSCEEALCQVQRLKQAMSSSCTWKSVSSGITTGVKIFPVYGLSRSSDKSDAGREPFSTSWSGTIRETMSARRNLKKETLPSQDSFFRDTW
jgi:hypothetical protein